MTAARTVLVTGATGRVGRHVVSGLLDRGVRVRALVRMPLLAGLPDDVEVATGDLTDPDSIADAAKGADAAFLLWPGFTADGADAVVAALTGSVGHVVYLSAARLQGAESGVADGVWGDIESLLEASAATHTFVRSGGFAVNTQSWAVQIKAGDLVTLPHPLAGRSLIHERDIADVSVAALLDPEHVGQSYSITGPQTLTQAEQVETIGQAVGRRLTVTEQSVEDARTTMSEEFGDAEFADHALSHWGSLVDSPERTTDDVARVTGQPARTFADWADEHVDDFRVLSTAEIATAYADGFRTGDLSRSEQVMSPELVRIAPIEPGGAEVRGVRAIYEHAEQISADLELLGVEVGDPLVGTDTFAIRFAFDEKHLPTGHRQVTIKTSVCTVEDGRIVREEVFYLTPTR